MSQKGFAPILIIILIAAVALGGGYLFFANQNKFSKEIACTADAKICPDGTSVGRTGPNCEFAACPKQKGSTSSAVISGWETYQNPALGFEINYPQNWYVVEYESNVGTPNPEKVLTLLFDKDPKPEMIYPLTHPWHDLSIYVSKRLHTNEALNKTGVEQGAELEGEILNKQEFKTTNFAEVKANKKFN